MLYNYLNPSIQVPRNRPCQTQITGFGGKKPTKSHKYVKWKNLVYFFIRKETIYNYFLSSFLHK